MESNDEKQKKDSTNLPTGEYIVTESVYNFGYWKVIITKEERVK